MLLDININVICHQSTSPTILFLEDVVTINVFCFNNGKVYVDEKFVGEINGTSLVRKRTEHPRLLAIQCQNDGANYGLLVSLSNRCIVESYITPFGNIKMEITIVCN